MSLLSRTSALFIGISVVTAAMTPAFAEDSVLSKQASSGAVKRQIVQQQKQVSLKAAETAKEKIASRTAVLKTKLQAFKDQRKAVAAEKINTNLSIINANQTKQMQNHLNTMTIILSKLENRVNQGTSDVKDPAAAKAAIASARALIATTSAAVSAQAEKDYTIEITSEAKIKTDANTQRNKLHADLLALRKMVVEAKQSVGNAIRIAKAGKAEIIEIKEGTTSGQQ